MHPGSRCLGGCRPRRLACSGVRGLGTGEPPTRWLRRNPAPSSPEPASELQPHNHLPTDSFQGVLKGASHTHALPQPGLLASPDHLRVKPDSRPSRYPSHPQPRGTHPRVLGRPLLRWLVLCWPPAAQAPPNRWGSAATVTLSNHTSDGASPAPNPPTLPQQGPQGLSPSAPFTSYGPASRCSLLQPHPSLAAPDPRVLSCTGPLHVLSRPRMPFPPLHLVSTAHPSACSTVTISSGFAEWFDQCLTPPLDQVRGAVVVSAFAPPLICGTELGLIKCLVNEHTCTARGGILV